MLLVQNHSACCLVFLGRLGGYTLHTPGLHEIVLVILKRVKHSLGNLLSWKGKDSSINRPPLRDKNGISLPTCIGSLFGCLLVKIVFRIRIAIVRSRLVVVNL